MRLPAIILPLLAAATLAASPAPQPITGDYLEVRTASVFAGACHYNGELVTTGRDAILAFNITSGSYHGVSLAGVRAVAAVTSDANLADEHAGKKSELVIDSTATSTQAAALTDALHDHFASSLGTVTATRRAPITFTHDAAGYTLNAPHFAAASVQPMPDAQCCKQPNLVWYQPMVPITPRKVGYTTSATYTAGTLTDPWQRNAENSAFYGPFSF